MLDFMIEGFVVVLLMVAISYCFIIDRRLRNFKNKQMEFNPVIDHLNQVTNNTEKIIGALKDAANGSNDELKRTISDAKNIAEDLSFLVDVSNKISHTLNLQMRQIDVSNSRSFEKSQDYINEHVNSNPVRKLPNDYNQNIPVKNEHVPKVQETQRLARHTPPNLDTDRNQKVDGNNVNNNAKVRQVSASDYLAQLTEKKKTRFGENLNNSESRLMASGEVENRDNGKTGLLNLLKKVR